MQQILLADSGSTKTHWRLINTSGDTLFEFVTGGINPALTPAHEVVAFITASLRKKRLAPNAVYYECAGCTPQRIFIVENALRMIYPQARISVHSDLVAALRALCGNDEGIACIIGTGMASCHCRDGEIVSQVPSLGFILGDEGSGAVLGRALLTSMFKEQLPPAVLEAWQDEYHLQISDLIERVYRKPAPNRFLASFAPFLHKHRKEEPIHDLLIREFRRFFVKNIAVYHRPDLPVNMLGGIANHFQEEIAEAAELEGYSIGAIIERPMDNLVRYHCTYIDESSSTDSN